MKIVRPRKGHFKYSYAQIIVEGLKADPIMNSHIEFDRKLVRGEIHTFENIDISMPMVLPSGEMMTINLHNFENKTLMKWFRISRT